MSQSAIAARTLLAGLFVILGSIILARGILEGAPITFSLMGALMIALGIYRYWITRTITAGRR